MVAVNRQGITEGQTQFLNLEYFSHDPSRHFDVVLWDIIRLADHTPGAVEFDEDTLAARVAEHLPGQTFDQQIADATDAESIEQAVIVQAVDFLHSVGESVIRLFFALRGCTLEESPWLEMASQKDKRWFNSECGKLVAGGPEDGKLLDDLRPVLFYDWAQLVDKFSQEKAEEILKLYASWVWWFAWYRQPEGMGAAQGHNQLKHGLAISGTNRLRIDFVREIANPEAPTVDELNAGVPLLTSASIRYLAKLPADEGNPPRWAIRTEDADSSRFLAAGYLGTRVFQNLWATGRLRYQVGPMGDIHYFGKPSFREVFGDGAQYIRFDQTLNAPPSE